LTSQVDKMDIAAMLRLDSYRHIFLINLTI